MTIDRPTLYPVLATLSCLLVGCGLYVNIPAQVGDYAYHDPNDPTVYGAARVALAESLQQRPVATPVQVVLAPGSTAETYTLVVDGLNSGQLAWSRSVIVEGLDLVVVRQIRIRGMDAEVDLVHHHVQGGGLDPAPAVLETVYLQSRPFGSWRATRSRVWNIDADQALAPLISSVWVHDEY